MGHPNLHVEILYVIFRVFRCSLVPVVECILKTVSAKKNFVQMVQNKLVTSEIVLFKFY